MTNNETSATVYDMEDARRQRDDTPGAAYRHAGAWLEASRKEVGASLVEVAEKIHIRERHLEAIEVFEIASMPARPYAIGFVRAYAEYLELDADAVVARFKADLGLVAEDVEKPPEKTEEPSAPPEKPELSLLAVVAILAFILVCIWQVTLPREVRRIGDNANNAPLEAPSENADLATPKPAEPENVIEAALLERVEPVYPMGCVADAGSVETVVIAFTVGSNGRVAGERVSSASNPCFRDAALNAIRRWRYAPRTVDGKPRPAFDQRVELSFTRPN